MFKPQKKDSAGNGKHDSDKLENNVSNAEPPGQGSAANKESYQTRFFDAFKKMLLSSNNSKGNAGSGCGSDHIEANGRNFNSPAPGEKCKQRK